MKIPTELHWSNLSGLEKERRRALTKELERVVNAALVKDSSLLKFQETLYSVMDTLVNAGYSIGNWDYDSEKEYWGGDSYMWKEPYTTEQLHEIDKELHAISRYPIGVELFWGSDESPEY